LAGLDCSPFVFAGLDWPLAWIRVHGAEQGQAQRDGTRIVKIRIVDVFGVSDPRVEVVAADIVRVRTGEQGACAP
jgi:hypothetical protein